MTTKKVMFISVKVRVIWGFVASAVLASAIFYYWNDRNPDWEGYRMIYENAGAWLADSGRDPTFLLLIEMFRSQGIVPSSYEPFRVTIAAVFIYFTFRFMSGKVIEFPSSHSIFVFLPFLSLVLIRSTIQIREGLAIVLLLLALGLVSRDKERYDTTRIIRWVIAIVLIALCSGTHPTALLVSAIIVLTIATMKLPSKIATTIDIVFVPMITAILFLGIFQFGLVSMGIVLVENLSGDRDAIEGGVNFAEAAIWTMFIILSSLLWLTTFEPAPNSATGGEFLQAIARNLAGPVAVTSGIAILTLKHLLVSPLVTVVVVRIAELGSSLAAVLVTVIYGRRLVPILLACFLVLKTFRQVSAAGF